jgi:alpha-glucosidase
MTGRASAMSADPPVPWWRSGVIYQVYPRSFQDHDGDGVGDLGGIRSRLGHLVDLGIDAVWISPIYRSPMADFGYDISDLRAIDPLFGTLDDLDALVAAAHEQGVKVLLDLVPGHTSDQHPWFVGSRSSRSDPKRDWYVWADAAPGGGPPNNWVSEFGGPAWTWDEGTDQYYLHLYLRAQPALNWRNPEVRAAIFEVMRFWLDRGVDGFRIDAVEHLVPDASLRDNPPDPTWTESLGPARRLERRHTAHQPEVLEIARQMRQVADDYDGDRVLVGEAYGSLAQVMAYYGDDLDGFQLPFNFGLIGAAWTARELAYLVEDYEVALPDGAWPNWVLGNHDRSRIASRVGAAQARVAAMLLLTLRGTPTLYQGDELGMTDVRIPPEAVRDPWELQVPGLGLGRDPVRTPIRWGDGPGGGFTDGDPWLPIGEDTPSVAAQRDDPSSMLRFHQRLIALRRDEPALSIGSYRTRSVDDDVFVYERRHEDRCLAVALNLTDRQRRVDLPGRSLLSTHGSDSNPPGYLRADEGRIVELA